MARARAEKGMASAVTDIDAREKALASAMEQIQKTFGKGSIVNSPPLKR